MPILFMALIALAVFLVMGLLLFSAAYAEAHTPHQDAGASREQNNTPRRAGA